MREWHVKMPVFLRDFFIGSHALNSENMTTLENPENIELTL